MMVPDIRHYDLNRKKRPKRVRRQTEFYRPDRGAPKQFLVYFIRMGDDELVKVGRTGNISHRVLTYENNSGKPARCCAQLIVDTEDHSIALEAHALALLQAAYKRWRREWFVISEADLSRAVALVSENSPVPIVEMRGAPGAGDRPVSALSQYAAEIVGAARQYRQKRVG